MGVQAADGVASAVICPEELQPQLLVVAAAVAPQAAQRAPEAELAERPECAGGARRAAAGESPVAGTVSVLAAGARTGEPNADAFYLPGEEKLLAARLVADRRGRAEAVGVGVAGGCGGAGASTLAAALACTAGARGIRAALVDADPWGGGLDLLVGAERASGPRWSQLAVGDGPIDPQALHDELPEVGGVRLVSFHRTGTPVPEPARFSAVLSALAGTCRLVVVDLGPAGLPNSRALLPFLDLVLLVAPATVRGVAASSVRLEMLGAAPVGVVVRDPSRGGIDAEAVARTLGVALVGSLRTERWLGLAAERGAAPVASGGGSMAGLCRSVLAAVMEGSRGRAGIG